ncbi:MULTISPECIES: sugar nucleotide-binding protein [Streptomyces]|uniref:sugar nucleotide-binding protein n=1 Tax=Streptomyces TaxID=1883 RepID=UPI0019A96F82|nr:MULTISPECIES: sugar nucleotide-binding protein [Streptomyces]GGS91864.1 hypothetical protein GCM10010286_15750 [Streptomyces toxytricini]
MAPLDLRDADGIDALLTRVRPDTLVNASSGGADWRVTAEGPVRLAIAAAKHGTRMVHVSSDAVFSGTRVHYDESSLPDPTTPYGAAKAAAETGILAIHPEAAVVRTSLIIGHGRSTHEKLVHDLATGTRDGVLFTDDFRCPVHVSDLAAALLELAAGETSGIHHARRRRRRQPPRTRHPHRPTRRPRPVPAPHRPTRPQPPPRPPRRTPRQPRDPADPAHHPARRAAVHRPGRADGPTAPPLLTGQ